MLGQRMSFPDVLSFLLQNGLAPSPLLRCDLQADSDPGQVRHEEREVLLELSLGLVVVVVDGADDGVLCPTLLVSPGRSIILA